MAGNLTRAEMVKWLRTTDAAALEELYAAALAAKEAVFGPKVHYRGLIEVSNICVKNCYYCGIRRDNPAAERYQMEPAEILAAAEWAHTAGYGSVVLQAGERSDAAFLGLVEDVVAQIKQKTGMGITLSLGEQTPETYARWFAAGAHRYLLRIETASPALYARLHPADHSHAARLGCLRTLREGGYQVGTGVMIGLPGQTAEELADDLLFYERLDVDMVGMGPYVVHPDTPLAGAGGVAADRNLQLGLTMIALTRLHLRDINIAAATALQALHPEGRELGIRAGANILMPNLTPTRYRPLYQLYAGKPCLDEQADQCRGCLERRLASVGARVGYNEWGDAPRAQRRKAQKADAEAQP